MHKFSKIILICLAVTLCFLYHVDAKTSSESLPLFLNGLGINSINSPVLGAISTVSEAVGGASLAIGKLFSGFGGKKKESEKSGYSIIPTGLRSVKNSLVQAQTIETMINVANASIMPGMMTEKRTEMVDKAVGRTITNARLLSNDLTRMEAEMNGVSVQEMLKKEALSMMPGKKNTDIGILKATASKNTADNIKAVQAARKALESPSAKCREVIECLVSVSDELKTMNSLFGADKINYGKRLKTKLRHADNLIIEIEKDLSRMDSDLKKKYVEILLRAKIIRDELSVSNSEMYASQKIPGSNNTNMDSSKMNTVEEQRDDLIRSVTGELTESQKKYNDYQEKYRNYTSAIFHGKSNLVELEKIYRKAFQVYLKSMKPGSK
ncbi:hypothetical protein KAJ27_14700 [bacterium]|nr:hypothetical protein [bacterium]